MYLTFCHASAGWHPGNEKLDPSFRWDDKELDASLCWHDNEVIFEEKGKSSMENFMIEFQNMMNALQGNLPIILIFIAGLWVLNFVNFLLGYRLNVLGLYPRTWHGLLGIFFSPFLHGDFNHLFFNSIPLFVLGSLVLLNGPILFYLISIIIILVSGILLWLFGRSGFHVGASGLIMGYWSYLVANAYQHRTASTIILAVVSLYYFGSLFFEIFPFRVKVSWEGHLFGFIGGMTAVGVLHYLGF